MLPKASKYHLELQIVCFSQGEKQNPVIYWTLALVCLNLKWHQQIRGFFLNIYEKERRSTSFAVIDTHNRHTPKLPLDTSGEIKLVCLREGKSLKWGQSLGCLSPTPPPLHTHTHTRGAVAKWATCWQFGNFATWWASAHLYLCPHPPLGAG